MDRFGLIGYPAAHSLSPKLFSEAYGGKYPYDIIETPDFDEAWSRFIEGYRAVNVTMPFKEQAAERADIKSPEVQKTGAANILVKTADGIAAHNSDYFAVLSILHDIIRKEAEPTVAVIGTGGAGKAAAAAAKSCGIQAQTYHHDKIADGVVADVIFYTLPSAVEGSDKLRCRILVEANYKSPCLKNIDAEYVPGEAWLKRQAIYGYELMTGRTPDFGTLNF